MDGPVLSRRKNFRRNLQIGPQEIETIFVFHHGGTEESQSFTERTSSVTLCVTSVSPW